MFWEGNINHVGSFFFFVGGGAVFKGKSESMWESMHVSHSPVWIWLKSYKYIFFPHKVNSGFCG